MLPQETADKIMHLYHNRIERRCIEVGLTVEEEKEWDYDDAKVDVDALSESGENLRNMIWMMYAFIRTRTTMTMTITLVYRLRN